MSQPDLTLLRAHMLCCTEVRNPWHRLRAAAEAVDAFLAPRFATTLALTLVLLASATLAA